MGRARGDRNRQATTTQRHRRQPVIGYSYLHTAIDDHSRLAYTEILTGDLETAWLPVLSGLARHLERASQGPDGTGTSCQPENCG